MNEHMQVVMNCYAKFPHLRFGQFLGNVQEFAGFGQLYFIPDRDLADACKNYAKTHGK